MTEQLQKYIECRKSGEWGWEYTYRKSFFKTDLINYFWLIEHYSMLLNDALDTLASKTKQKKP